MKFLPHFKNNEAFIKQNKINQFQKKSLFSLYDMMKTQTLAKYRRPYELHV